MEYASKTPNKELMAQARESLKGVWGLAIGAVVIYSVIAIGIQYVPFLGGIASLIISGPMVLGLIIFYLSLSRKQNPQIPQIFDGFKRFGTSLGAYLLTALFIFLWFLCLIVPGIIAAYSYAMTFYIIADNDTIGPYEAIKKSKEMMRGNRMKLFYLSCRFIGWGLLCILTLGIGFLWLGPYAGVSHVKFYEDLLKSKTA